MKSKYYAVVTPHSVGVFSSWACASVVVTGTKNSLHKAFKSYEEAKAFVLEHLSKDDFYDFCLDRCELYLNKNFVRKAHFIARKEARTE